MHLGSEEGRREWRCQTVSLPVQQASIDSFCSSTVLLIFSLHFPMILEMEGLFPVVHGFHVVKENHLMTQNYC